MDRNYPVIPVKDKQLSLIIDTDAANEIDDLYAIAMALRATDRFDIQGFVATHFAQKGNRDTIRESYETIRELLKVAGSDFRIEMGGDPMCYPGEPSDSDGAQLIIECAKKASPETPLVVLGLGAATNLASSWLLAPEIAENTVFMFRGRSEDTWPVRSQQFNIYGDIIACSTLLESDVPLIWFDTGTNLHASMTETASRLEPLGDLGRYLHEYRKRCDYFQMDNKGFFDVGDVAWLMDNSLCHSEMIDAPRLTRWMYFDHTRPNGKMMYISDIDVNRTWDLFYKTIGNKREDI